MKLTMKHTHTQTHARMHARTHTHTHSNLFHSHKTYCVEHDGVFSAGYLHGDGRLVVCDGANVLPSVGEVKRSSKVI